MAESEYKFVPIAENLEEQPSVIVNGKAYKEDKELNDFLNDNGLNVDTDALKFDIYNNINLKKFDINESRVLVEINDFTQYINQEEIVPGSLHTMLTLVSKEQKQRKLNIADFGFVDLQSLVAEANLNIVEKNSHPLKPGEYIAFVKVVWKTKIKNEVASVIVPLGADVKKSFSVGLKETELYFYAAKRQIKSKVIYSFDEHYQTLKITSEEMLDFNPSKLFGDLKNKTANPGKLYKGFQKYIYPMIYSVIKVMPVKKNRIFFASDSRAEMGGNFEFLNYELMNQGFDDVHYVFNENQFVKKSLRTFLKFAWLTATAEYIFIEESHPMLEHVSIKHKVNVIQTWHAAGAFKTFGYTSMRLMAQDTSKMNFHRYYTNATVSSEAMVPIYSEAFDVDSDIIKPLGLARSDLFWNDMLQYERINNLKQEYDFLNTGKKVILFAPTFRGAGRKQAHYPFEYLDLKAIYEAFKDDYIFLIKVHFNTL
ncbi:MAG: CDP-glycerol glycerophosphotransferase family protein, partial [Leuconostoc mesenteroides]